MTIESGTTLAHYEILAPLGKGGMGEVFRARDTKLGREVAIKVLPEEFTRDAERLSRFDREARMLASLNHPHVASIHGFEESEGVKFLVMELAEGMTLADRLRAGPIPIDEAIAITKQIIDALESAHDKGIIHRDLKPANVVIDDEGEVKVLDFGLAKALDADESSTSGTDITNSPTMIRAATHAGVILGTAAYMSPEQAKGKRVDRRADIWSLGVVLFEMLTGEKLFEGETVSETLAAVIMKDVDFDRLPATTPPPVRTLVHRCLTKDRRNRLQAIGEARILLSGDLESVAIAATPQTQSPSGGRLTKREIMAWALVTILVVALVSLAVSTRPQQTQEMSVTTRLAAFDDESLVDSSGSSVIISPDGTKILYVATGDEGARRLFIQRFDQLGVVPIPGTEGAESPFFSPDGGWVGFFADRQLKKVATSGGPPIAICDAPAPRGGTWGENGSIVFSGSLVGGLSIVSEDGGAPQPLTTLDESKSERSHRWPHFLPGGVGVLYLSQISGRNYDDSPIQVVSLESGETKEVVAGGSYPGYARSGHLLFVRDGSLFAMPFDLSRLESSGTPKPVLHEVFSRTENEATDDGTAHYDLSSDGRLVYRAGSGASSLVRLVIVDRSGATIAESQPNHFWSPELSPDGKRVAVTIQGDSSPDIWVWNIERDTMSRLTFEDTHGLFPIWSPDGERIAFSSAPSASGAITTADATYGLLAKAADGSGRVETITEGMKNFAPTSWSSDGRTIILHGLTDRGVEISAVSINDDPANVSPVVTGPGITVWGDLSPDGRWIAYQSDESGSDQVYVQPFPEHGGKWQVSVDGGTEPSWTKGGKEIIWRNADQGWFAAPIASEGDRFVVGQPERLELGGRYLAIPPFRMWDVSTDGETFVMCKVDESEAIDTKTVVLVTNWLDRLRETVPVD